MNFDPLKQVLKYNVICNFIITFFFIIIVFKIWLKCTSECAENAISIETHISYKYLKLHIANDKLV